MQTVVRRRVPDMQELFPERDAATGVVAGLDQVYQDRITLHRAVSRAKFFADLKGAEAGGEHHPVHSKVSRVVTRAEREPRVQA